MKNIKLLHRQLVIAVILSILSYGTGFAQNLILNPSFETGDLQSWSAWQPNGNGTVTIVSSNQRTGSYAVQVNSRQASLEQVVTGLIPNTTYTYSAWIKCSTGAAMWIGVKDYGNTETYAVANATVYEKKIITFTTGAANTSAKVYFYRHPDPIYGNTNAAWGDDFELTQPVKLDLGITGSSLLRVYETASNFSLTIRPTITQGAVDNSFKLWYYWKDFFGNVQGRSELQLNVNNTILAPSNQGNKKFYSLVFETNSTSVLLPQRTELGTSREYGVCFLNKTPTTEKLALNNYPLGTLHLGDPAYDDPYMPSMINRNQKMEVPFSSTGTINSWYITELNNLINKGFQPVPWVARQEGAFWNWNDSQPITDIQLQQLEQQMEAYFRVSSQILYYEVGWEENVQFSNGTRLTDYPYYWANLKRKIEVTKRAANRVNPNIKLCYQLSTTNPSVSALPFFTSEASAYYDVLAFHSYKFDNNYSPENWLVQAIADTKNLIQQYRPNMELWITEIGIPNDPLTTTNGSGIRRLDMKEASLFMAKSVVMSLANGVKKVFWYNYHDKCTDINNIECQFGMIDYWGFPRSYYATFHNILKTIRDKTFKRKIDVGNNNIYAYEFEASNGEKTIVSWTYPSSSNTIALSGLGINNSSLVKETLATEGSPVSLIQNSTITIPDYPVFINLRSPSIPVELMVFKANAKDTKNLLEWQTASERNCKGFEVQRSNDSKIWTTIGFVNGHGNSGTVQTYMLYDDTPLSISYYRLRQIDFDGKKVLSKVIIVVNENKTEVRLFPNPTNEKIFIDASNVSSQRVRVINELGQILIDKVLNNNEIDIAHLPKGIYYIELSSESRVVQKRIFKN